MHAMGIGGRAIVRDRDGRILLIQRAADVSWDPGLWELPGGKADYRETIADAIVREAREETGLALEVGRPIHVGHFVKEPFWVTTVTFACELAGDAEMRLSEEHDDFAWVELSDVSNLECTVPAREAVAAYLAHVGSRATP